MKTTRKTRTRVLTTEQIRAEIEHTMQVIEMSALNDDCDDLFDYLNELEAILEIMESSND